MTVRSLLALIVLLAGPLAHAETPGRLSGLAQDETAGPFPGVTVGLHALAGALDRSLTTDAQGRFEVLDLPPGRYRVDFRFPGFATAVRTVELEAGGAVRLEVTLRIALNADVLVTAAK